MFGAYGPAMRVLPLPVPGLFAVLYVITLPSRANALYWVLSVGIYALRRLKCKSEVLKYVNETKVYKQW